jgi:Domain of unknown function (DUF4390)
MNGFPPERAFVQARIGLRQVFVWGMVLSAILAATGIRHVAAAGVEVVSASIAMNLAGSAIARQVPTANPDGVTMRSIDPSTATDAKSEGRPDTRLDTQLVPEGWLLNADVKFSVNARLEDLLEQGVPLHFVTEVEAYRPRWYWKDELVLSSSQSVKLSYQAITRQYRVSRGPLSINFSNLSDALRAMGTVRSWRFAEGKALPLKTRYDVYVRFRLDKSQLPKPFQLTMLTDSDWVPVSEWKHFSFITDPTRTAP